MTEKNDTRELTDEELLPLMVASEHRKQNMQDAAVNAVTWALEGTDCWLPYPVRRRPADGVLKAVERFGQPGLVVTDGEANGDR
jgi:hypothetical protein